MSGSNTFTKGILDAGQLDTVTANLKSVVSAAGQFLGTLVEIQNASTAQALKSFRATIQKNSPIRFSAGQTCGEPWQDCCNSLLGTVSRNVHLKETVYLSAKLRNGTDKARAYTLDTKPPLRNSRGETGGTLLVHPETLNLKPGEIGLVEARVEIGKEFRVGDTYTAEVVVRTEGCEPQSLVFVINVESLDNAPIFDLCCACDVPAHRLRYYHHFYCDEAKRKVEVPKADVAGVVVKAEAQDQAKG